MFEKISLRVFLTCLVVCASMILFAIWTSSDSSKPPEAYFKTVATLFIVGLASALLWFVQMLHSLRTILRDR
jgi:hypothetical protein